MRLYEHNFKSNWQNSMLFIWCVPDEITSLPRPVHLTDQYCGEERMVGIVASTLNLVALTLLGLDVSRFYADRD